MGNFCGEYPSMASYVALSCREGNRREIENAERREDMRVEKIAEALSNKGNGNAGTNITININISSEDVSDKSKLENLSRTIGDSIKEVMAVADSPEEPTNLSTTQQHKPWEA